MQDKNILFWVLEEWSNYILMKEKSRSKLLAYNSITSLFSQGITVICSFVLTRLILSHFGSSVNGLVSSITQFLGFISFLEMGIGAVVKSALYKPLADKNYDEVSRVIISTKKFYRTIAKILILYTIVLTIAFPIISREEFSPVFTGSLVLIIAISLFAQYYFGMPYQLLLNADQRIYIPTITCCTTLIINTVLSAFFIYMGASIQIVKLITSLVYVIRPIFYSVYVRKNYPLNEKQILKEEPLKQKWNGLAQHIAYVVVNYTDIVVLTILSTMTNVSIYTVYHNVTIGVQQVISSISVGISAMLGNVLYSETKERLQDTFGLVEWFFHTVTVTFFTITGIMIMPFVQLYTKGVEDANYIVPAFAILITVAQASYSIRTPYETMVLAANHFKQTQRSAIIEVVINICVSVTLVFKFGLIGVAIGTLAAMSYRTIYFVFYLKNHILKYNIWQFVKLLILDAIQVMICLGICYFFHLYLKIDSWSEWIVRAVLISIISFAVCGTVNYIFNRQYMKNIIKKILKRN